MLKPNIVHVFQDNSENIDFRDYLLCAIFINQSNVPAIQLLESISKVRRKFLKKIFAIKFFFSIID